MTAVWADAITGHRIVAAIIPPSTCLFILASVGRVRGGNARAVADVPAPSAGQHLSTTVKAQRRMQSSRDVTKYDDSSPATKQSNSAAKRKIITGTRPRVFALARGMVAHRYRGQP